MTRELSLFFLLLTGLPVAASGGQKFVPGKNTPILRGETQNIFFVPAHDNSMRQDCKVIFAPGDGGWRGMALAMADSIASWGYDVYGLDTKRYLSSFTGNGGLTEALVMSDFHQIAQWIDPADSQNVIVAGWSEGAGLCLLGAAASDNKSLISGLLTIGLPDSNVLGWRFIDNLTYLTKQNPNEKMFASANYLPLVSPSPIFMIQSTGDEYVSLETARQMYGLAREPKRFVSVEAKNHHFSGNQDEFFNALREGLLWIRKPQR